MVYLCRVSLVEPIPGSTKLKVNEHGIAALRAISGPLAPVMVIGPYRSGKSFLINQMLEQNCGVSSVRLSRCRCCLSTNATTKYFTQEVLQNYHRILQLCLTCDNAADLSGDRGRSSVTCCYLHRCAPRVGAMAPVTGALH